MSSNKAEGDKGDDYVDVNAADDITNEHSGDVDAGNGNGNDNGKNANNQDSTQVMHHHHNCIELYLLN